MVQGIERREKHYVEVIADHDVDGRITPLQIIWDDGRTFDIDRVTERRYAASMKVGGHGLRYTVYVMGKPKHLWHDDKGWYVEAIVNSNKPSLQ